jgi:arginyl-tRNA synthetase
MNILSEIKDGFRPILEEYCDSPEEVEELLNMIRRSNLDCDYQANFAMVLGKRLGRPARELAAEILNKMSEDHE